MAVKSAKTTKTGYTKKAKVEKKKEEVTDILASETKPVVEDTVIPSDNLEDAIAEIWDAFVLRNILNPKLFGDREMIIFKLYNDVANSIIASKKEEALKIANVAKITEDSVSV